MFLLCVYSQNDEMSIMANKNKKQISSGWVEKKCARGCHGRHNHHQHDIEK